MARPLRIEYAGAWYHVMNRGLEKRAVFLSDKDCQNFLRLLKEACEIFDIEIHAYSLMVNHYHLLVHTPQSGLGRAMRQINGIYTQIFNKTHDRDGPLFRGRYKALLIDSNEHLLTVARYIHRNPVVASLSGLAGEHPWTSHQHYLRPAKAPRWLNTTKILGHFGHGTKAIRDFDNFVSQNDSHQISSLLLGDKNGVLGTDGFRTWVLNNFVSAEQKNNSQIVQKEKQQSKRPSASAILHQVAFAYNVSVPTLCQGRSGLQNDARSVAAFLLRRHAGLPLQEIAMQLKMASANAAGISIHRLVKRIKQDPKLSAIVAQIPTENRPASF